MYDSARMDRLNPEVVSPEWPRDAELECDVWGLQKSCRPGPLWDYFTGNPSCPDRSPGRTEILATRAQWTVSLHSCIKKPLNKWNNNSKCRWKVNKSKAQICRFTVIWNTHSSFQPIQTMRSTAEALQIGNIIINQNSAQQNFRQKQRYAWTWISTKKTTSPVIWIWLIVGIPVRKV